MQRKRRRRHDGTMDFILAVMFVSLMIFTVVMTVIFCIYQTVPDTLIQCFFTAFGAEGGFMAVIAVTKKFTEKDDYE
ncbi:MAG: hypothetical protein IJM23_09665 [Lachnospiraceae bacterium]|nr:hypothetical protein [Lachnospiraceae bacterium]